MRKQENILEVLIFISNNNYYAFDICYISEIINYEKIQDVPYTHPCIEGVLFRRDKLITIINFNHFISLNGEYNPNSSLIVTSINDKNIGFHVDKVIGIQKIENKNIILPNKIIRNSKNEIDKILHHEEKLIILLDIEYIVEEISCSL